MTTDDSILGRTLQAARRDVATVSSSGAPLQRLTDGVVIRRLPTHTDRRGSVTELFDPRPGSPTCGEVCRITLTERDRCIVNVPRNVWHADHNIGTRDVLVVNFPTIVYDHAAPDKWRLPLDTPLIPYSFAGVTGG